MWIKSVTVLSIFIQSARSLGCPVALSPSASPSDPFWMSNPGLHVLGKSAYNPGYKVYRNVKTTYGAVGDGIADDTAAINRAISGTSRMFGDSQSEFINDSKSPMIARDTLMMPRELGGIGVLDLEARNEALLLVKAAALAEAEPEKRSLWASLALHRLSQHTVKSPVVAKEAKTNLMIQNIKVNQRNPPALHKTMVKCLNKYGISFETVQPSGEILRKLPLWHHPGENSQKRQENNGKMANCLRKNHDVLTVSDGMNLAQRLEDPLHYKRASCECDACEEDKETRGCENPQASRQQSCTSPPANYYFTSLVGDFKKKPTLIADANFVGVAVIDANPYIDGASNPDGTGVNWWLKNFVIDVRAMSPDKFGTGIHWQVGQATSLINIDFKMSSVAGTKHQGVFAENGSGGFMSDLTFDGGAFGLWISNQQFTIRNVKITNAGTAIYEQWNWGFTWQNINISNCQVGFDLHTGGLTLDTQSAGGVLIVDSWITNVGIGIRMSSSQPTRLGGSVILDNIIFTSIFEANIRDQAGVLLPASTGTVGQWVQGNVYSDVADPLAGLTKSYKRGGNQPSGGRAHALVNAFGAYFSKPRPQYENYKDIQFQNLMAFGAAGDGIKDDTAAINAFLQRFSGCAILCDIQPSHSILGPLTFFTVIEAGTYLVTDTIFVPPGTIIVGQMFSVIMGSGPKFANQNTPTPVLRVGNPGDTGAVEISDLVITTTGGSAGAIGIEWNVKASSQGAAGMWDVHVRLGGTKGTNINAANCPASSTNAAKCASAFLGFHITRSGSGYFENVWVWNADHDLDDPAESKLNVFSGRGVLVESTGPVWLVGTASEHHVIYQYAFNKARDIWAGLIQTETPYFQPTPKPPAPFSINPLYGDPAGPLTDSWGLVITLSSNIFVYGPFSLSCLAQGPTFACFPQPAQLISGDYFFCSASVKLSDEVYLAWVSNPVARSRFPEYTLRHSLQHRLAVSFFSILPMAPLVTLP
ncbi:pectate lyase superfamily protein-domain-containing protein [Mycena rebaudengoi]|nr:pectate lyase superfamily protein-domain-containing protein [Mycena rebaudengoi]